MMIERLYFTVLKQGFAELRANPLRIERFFSSLGLSKDEVRSIRAWFEASDPSVNQAYPRHGASRFPGVFIVLEEENEQQKFLNDSAGFLTPEEVFAENIPELVGMEIKSSIYQYKHHLLIVADNPDKCLYLYHITRYVLTRQRDELERYGLLYSQFSGADAAPDPNYLPETFFVRRLTVRAMAQAQVVNESERFMPISAVGEISLEDGTVGLFGVDNG
jgi:hypothetical protein